jgi:hypothetical protein
MTVSLWNYLMASGFWFMFCNVTDNGVMISSKSLYVWIPLFKCLG